MPDPESRSSTETSSSAQNQQAPDERGAQARQMLGMKGADTQAQSVWQLRLQLMKPVTWVPLVWGVICGAASSGSFSWSWENLVQAVACMLLSGPIMTGYTQTLNDFFDREIDAINEPYRPIPSGAVSERQAIAQIVVLLLAGFGLAYGLDAWTGNPFPALTAITAFGAFLAYIYSAPPLKLKRNGWLGNYALGASYIALPWWAGHALFGTLTPTVVVLTLVYSLAGLGIAVVNDFKSVEGDRQLGLKSLPVLFGIGPAAWICVLAIDVFQTGIAGYLIGIGENRYATLLLLLVIPQIVLQDMYFLRDPAEYDVKYQASAQPFLVLGMLVTGLAFGHAGV